MKKEKGAPKSYGRKIAEWVITILFIALCAVSAYLLAVYLFTSIDVDGHSMESTLHDGDRVLLVRHGNRYRYGDIVVFDSGQKNPDGGARYFVKRIIGMPGDTIEIIYDGNEEKFYLWRNGEKLQEEYISTGMYAEMPRVTVPAGQFFYMGDNRSGSSDSRVYGCTALDHIVGRVVLRFHYNGSLKDFDISFVKRLSAGGFALAAALF